MHRQNTRRIPIQPGIETTPFSAWSTAAPSYYNNNNGDDVAQGALAPFHVTTARDLMLAALSPGPEACSSSFIGAPLQFSYDQYPRAHVGCMERQKMTAQEIVEAKALAASKSHSEAERRRRERINSHLATLRTLLPSTTKTDKASLLAEVIEHVKELKRLASDIGQGSPLPSEADEVSVDSEKGTFIRASLCCEDRPDLLADVIQTLRCLRLRAVKAEMATLGGRVKNVLLVTNNDEVEQQQQQQEEEEEEEENTSSSVSVSLSTVQEALKALLQRHSPNSSQLSPATGNKRQRQVGQFGASSLQAVLDDARD